MENNRINEEFVAVDALKHVLTQRCGCKEVQIVPEKKDPPDFWVTIDGVTFPTEVTSIVSNQQYDAQCEEFSKAIQRLAESRTVLSGTYALTTTGFPRIPKPTSKDGKRLLEMAVSFINETQTNPELKLLHNKMGIISISKLSPNGFTVGLCRNAPWLWEGEIQIQVAPLIQHAVDEKIRKLQSVGIEHQRALLLLYDAFVYADLTDARAAITQITGFNWFHSIFWAASFSNRENMTYPNEPGRNGGFLYSVNRDWMDIETL